MPCRGAVKMGNVNPLYNSVCSLIVVHVYFEIFHIQRFSFAKFHVRKNLASGKNIGNNLLQNTVNAGIFVGDWFSWASIPMKIKLAKICIYTRRVSNINYGGLL